MLFAFIQTFIVSCLICLLSVVSFTAPCYAHRPHDVITEVAISPDYAQDESLLIIVRSNLFKSSDGGVSWQRLVNGLDMRSTITDLSISQLDKNILFVSSSEDGIYKSLDGGNSWQHIGSGLESLQIDLLVTSPVLKDIVLAADRNGNVYRTLDGGENWLSVFNSDYKITALAFSKLNPNQIVLGNENGEIFWSQDQGLNWQKRSDVEIRSGITAIELVSGLASESTRESILVATQEDGIFRLEDEGVSWSQLSNGLPEEAILDIASAKNEDGSIFIFASTWDSGVFSLQGDTWIPKVSGLSKDSQANQMGQPHFTDLEIADNGTLFLGGFNGLFKSDNQAERWSLLETLARGTIVDFSISPHYAKDGTIVAITYVGDVYLSKDQGKTWNPVNTGLEVPRLAGSFREIPINQDPRRFYDVIFSPTYETDQTIFASLLWTKFLRTENQAESWSITPMPDEVRGITIAPSPNFATDQTIYLSNQQGKIYRSTNGGQKFALIGNISPLRGNFGTSLVISPNFSFDQTLYASGERGIYKSIDAGQTWQGLTETEILAEAGKIQIAISPSYTVDQMLLVSTNIGLFQTRDAGETWTRIDTILTDDLEPYLEGVAISPDYQNDRTFIVSIRGKGLFKTTNDGATFEPLGDRNLPFARMGNVPSAGLPIQFSPNYQNDQTIYGFGAANSTLFRSIDAGNTWERLSIPVYPEEPYNTAARLKLWLYLNQSRLLKAALLLIAIGSTYFALSYLAKLRKNYVLRAWQSLIVVVLILGVFFRFANLGDNVYSADEVRSILRLSGYTSELFQQEIFNGTIVSVADIQGYQVPNGARNLLDAIQALASNPEHPPLYHLLTRFWMQLFHHPLSARIASIVIGLLALPCVYWLCMELFRSQLVAWITILLIAISPFHIMAAQNTTQYSLWLLTIALSSAALLKAVRNGIKREWLLYSVTLAASFYTHLFSAILAFIHSFYLAFLTLFSKKYKSWKILSAYIISSIGALVIFSPWLFVIITNLDVVEENTRYYRQFDNNFSTIWRRFIANLGNVFLDLHNRTRFEQYFDLLLVVLVLYSLYFLWKNAEQHARIFLLLLIVITPIAHIIPDLISPSARSLQTRYYLPCFLGIEIAIAYLLAGYMKLIALRSWQQRLGQLTLVGLLSCGIISGIFVMQTGDWGLDDQRGTASGFNLQVAPLINQAENPLVISTATHSFVLALSHFLDEHVHFQLLRNQDFTSQQSKINFSNASQQFSDVMLYIPNQALLDFVEQQEGFTTSLVADISGRKLLYRVIEDSV